ncbi:MAG TPA: DEAD/DEAH box helicase [Gaiellaceae bacterium]|nr:DEAD/DEAH box helicase [Gaiellaceae bacterium]
MRVSELIRFGAPPALAKVWAAEMAELTEIQAKAVEAGVLDGRTNLLVVGPTSSGKTLVGEMAAAATSFRTRRHGIFLVPFRALADEHYATFRARYGELLNVVISTSDWTEFDDDIRVGNFGLAVLTYEKLTGLLVEHPQLLDRCSVVVVDEVQMIGDGGRGANLEKTLTQVLLHEQAPQVVALSASLDELNKLDDWLRATLVMVNERPVPLEEGVLAPFAGRMLMVDETERQLTGGRSEAEEALDDLVASLVDEGNQLLVFRASVPKTQSTAERLKRSLPAPGLAEQTAAELDQLEPSETVELLRRTLASGVGFHNGDMTAGERRAVEQSFRRGEARVLVATTTLAMGVNMPTDVVVVADYKRFYPARGQWQFSEIPVSEYKNAAGRAGRLGQRSSGLAVLLAERDSEQRQMLDYYCRGEVEAVESQLPKEAFADVVFGILCGGLAHNRAELVEFITATFAYLTFYELSGGIVAVESGVVEAARFCCESGLVREEDGQLLPTRAALVFAASGIPLAVATRLSTLADLLREGPIGEVELVFEIANCDQLFDRRPYIDWDKLRGMPVDPRTNLRFDLTDVGDRASLRQTLAKGHLEEREARVIARTACLLAWMGGLAEERIGRRFRGCPPARLRGMGKTAAWLLEALERVATLRGVAEEQVETVRIAAAEARYGVPVELAALARLPQVRVGRAALMRLYEGDKGRQLYEPDVLLEADLPEFNGLLTPAEVERLRRAIVAERGETLRRRRDGHLERAQRAQLDAQLIEGLYTATGGGLEQAVTDALDAVGIPATRIVRQPQGEEDLQIDHADGTVVVSVTASADAGKRISWNKAREVLGTGTGMNPANYVCIGRPGFHSLAERKATEILRERGSRRLLLVPIDVLGEAIIRTREGQLDSTALADALARRSGLLTLRDLPLTNEVSVATES